MTGLKHAIAKWVETSSLKRYETPGELDVEEKSNAMSFSFGEITFVWAEMEFPQYQYTKYNISHVNNENQIVKILK